MSIKQAVNDNPIFAVLAAIAALGVAAGALVWALSDKRPDPVGAVYFYDLATDELFTGGSDVHPPIEAPSGRRAGVRAYVFACDAACPPARELVGLSWEEIEQTTAAFISHFERYSDQAHRTILEGPRTGDPQSMGRYQEAMMQGLVVRRPGDDQWVGLQSSAGSRVTAHARERCGAAPPQRCHP